MAVKIFALEQVLNYRREIEKERKQDFVSAKQDLERASDMLKQQEMLVENLAKDFSQRQSKLDSIEDLRRYTDYFARKRKDIFQQKEQVGQLGSIVEDRREDLLVATKDKKVLESLKEKRAKESKMEIAQKERAFLDEICIQKKDKLC